MYQLVLLFFLPFQYQLNAIHDPFCGDRTCYEVLSIESSADQNEIKKAFRKLATLYHPDINKNADSIENFFGVNNAYEVLTKQRDEYDKYLEAFRSSIKEARKRSRIYQLFDVKGVIIAMLFLLSLLQWYLMQYNYHKNVEYHMTLQRYRNIVAL